jgi:hypothetical protein
VGVTISTGFAGFQACLRTARQDLDPPTVAVD